MERLNKFLAQAGIASRRQADRLIEAGKVSVNGLICSNLGVQIDPEQDRVRVEGKLVEIKQAYEYWLLNKPPGYLTTVNDPFRRATVMELIPKTTVRLYPVGRLDLDTSGLLLFTNDGEVALALTHPRHLVEKIYLAKVLGVPNQNAVRDLENGIILSDGATSPAKIAIEKVENGNAIVRIILREGRKRQVKRMLQAVGHLVLELKRIAMGPLVLGDLKEGVARQLNPTEIGNLLELKKLVPKEGAGIINVSKSTDSI